MNVFSGVGRLTHDPELRKTNSGLSVLNFQIAINRPFKNKETGQYEADFIRCTAWRGTAEFIERNFSKGKSIGIVGRLQTSKYTDKYGHEQTSTVVLVEQAMFTGDKGSTRPQPSAQPSDNGFFNDFDDTALPFDL